MAKKKTRKAFHKSHRRKRVSSIGAIDSSLVYTVGGAVLAGIIAKKLSTSSNSTLSKFGNYIPIAAGIVLPMFVKNETVKRLSVGLLGGGAVFAFKGISGGVGQMKLISYPGQMNQLKPVAGVGQSNFSASRMSQMNTISGIMDAFQGDNAY